MLTRSIMIRLKAYTHDPYVHIRTSCTSDPYVRALHVRACTGVRPYVRVVRIEFYWCRPLSSLLILSVLLDGGALVNINKIS